MLPDTPELEDIGRNDELGEGNPAEGEKEEGAGDFHVFGNSRIALRRFAGKKSCNRRNRGDSEERRRGLAAAGAGGGTESGVVVV